LATLMSAPFAMSDICACWKRHDDRWYGV